MSHDFEAIADRLNDDGILPLQLDEEGGWLLDCDGLTLDLADRAILMEVANAFPALLAELYRVNADRDAMRMIVNQQCDDLEAYCFEINKRWYSDTVDRIRKAVSEKETQ